MKNYLRSTWIVVLLFSVLLDQWAHAQRPNRRGPRVNREAALAEPYKGVFFQGHSHEHLYKIQQTGVSTESVKMAAEAFLAGLDEAQRKQTLFPVGDLEWRKWDNRHSYERQGVGFDTLNEKQRALAFALVRSGLSARGLKQTQDIMKLNGTLEEITQRPGYGEWAYYMTIMGTPSLDQPWGWQLDGHHVIINYFVLGDQVVMSPVFMGSEPVTAQAGKFKGTQVCQLEQNEGLAFMNSLEKARQEKATIKKEKDGTNNLAEAFKDNLSLEYVGLPAKDMTEEERQGLLKLIEVYIGHMEEGHAKVRMAEVVQHLDATRFAWMGGTEDDAVFYYRIQSPVLLIEFDHQRPVAIARSQDPIREHIHTVVRTPNGNDYGKDLLRQHYQKHHHK